MQSVTQRRRESGFTLVELLVVIGIIALLVGILIPTIARVRQAAFATDSAATVRALTNAIQTYYDDFQAYPGPLADDQIGIGLGNFSFPAPGDRSANFTFDVDDDGTDDDSLLENIAATNGITGTENLALGLLGGLVLDAGGAILYDPQAVGSGPRLLGGTPGSRPSYVDLERDRLGFTFAADNKETGRFRDNTASANDTIIPEFVDSFPSPMPILYLRAQSVGFSATPRDLIAGSGQGFAFNLNHVIAYTAPVEGTTVGANARYIGEGREELDDFHSNNGSFHGLQLGVDGNPGDLLVPGDADPNESPADANGRNRFDEDGPYDAIPYLADPSAGLASGNARASDSYVLISAGPDRVYGTRDDITSFGKVGQ